MVVVARLRGRGRGGHGGGGDGDGGEGQRILIATYTSLVGCFPLRGTDHEKRAAPASAASAGMNYKARSLLS